MRIDEFITRFENVKRYGNGYLASCPCPGHNHGDKTQSLHISVGDNGGILLNCFVGHDAREVVQAVGLEMRDLFPDPTQEEKRQNSIKWMEGKQNLTFKESYSYCYGPYGDGLTKIRFLKPDGDKTFFWIHDKPESQYGIAWGQGSCPHRLYIKGNPDADTIYLVEGEKDANTLYRLLKQTTASPENGASKSSGGGKWREEYTRQLEGKTVYILGDNDEVGREYATLEATELHGRAAHVYILDLTKVWPECPNKGDVTDMREALGRDDTISRIQALVQEAVEYIPESPVQGLLDASKEEPEEQKKEEPEPFQPEDPVRVVERFFATVQTTAYKPVNTGMEDIDELLGGGIMRQSLVQILAAPGMGKTTLCQQMLEGMAANGHEVMYINLEMSRDQLLAKSLSRLTGTMSAKQVLLGYQWTDNQRRIVEAAYDRYVKEIAPRMRYNPAGTSNDLRSLSVLLDRYAAEAKAANKPAPIVCIDYVHLVKSERMDTMETLKATNKMLKDYAIANNTFVISICATNRTSNEAKKITINSGRDSSDIEYSGDYVISMNFAEGVDNVYESPRRIKITLLKGRLDQTGESKEMEFKPEYNLFRSSKVIRKIK